MSNIVIYGYGGDGENIPVYGYGGEWLPRPVEDVDVAGPVAPATIALAVVPIYVRVKTFNPIKKKIDVDVTAIKDIRMMENILVWVYNEIEGVYRAKINVVDKMKSVYSYKGSIYANKGQKVQLRGKKSYKAIGKALDESFLSVLLELYSRRKKDD